MARILTTAFVADIRNSVAGTTFSKGRYGNYCKAKTSGSKRNSQYQNNWRSQQAQVALQWKGLTESQRQGWVDASSNFPQVDKFGGTFYLSGFNLFLQLNLNHLIGVGGYIFDAPAPQDVESVMDYEISISWDAVNSRWQIDAFVARPMNYENYWVSFYCTQPGSPGKMTIGKTVYFLYRASTFSEEHDLSAEFQEFFGVPGVGQKVFFQINYTSVISGQVSVRQNVSRIFPAH